ncbi:AI-2E family transporter [Methylobacterium organophilum]|uniref:AI-2E family transporter n=1 Tax=Methylobacterium organophilum TaxID=410 RepID=A0ABQ4T230_METOR|nr:hypothetical protein LKMONMHP_0411 [Methylobacterium organophilum]
MSGPAAGHAPGGEPRRRSLTVSGIAVVAFTALLALAWMASATLLLIFAGILLGVFLDGLTRGLGRLLPLPRAVRLALASLGLVLFLAGLSAYGGATVAQQARDLGTTIQQQSTTVRDWLKDRGIDIELLQAPEGEGSGRTRGDDGKGGPQQGGLAGLASGVLKSPGSFLSDAGNVLGPAAAVVLGLFNALGNLLVIAFLGAAVAADPASYRDGALHFLPPDRRKRGGEVLDAAGETLRHWLFGQLVTMTVIFLCTWAGLAFLGVGGALILGLQAGLLAFVPTVGPLVAGVVIILASLASGFTATLGALGVYLAVQTLESYVLTPFIQKRALDIPPATIFAGQLLLGVLFGLWGIALALPMLAVIKVLLERLYIEDTLGEAAEG